MNGEIAAPSDLVYLGSVKVVRTFNHLVKQGVSMAFKVSDITAASCKLCQDRHLNKVVHSAQAGYRDAVQVYLNNAAKWINRKGEINGVFFVDLRGSIHPIHTDLSHKIQNNFKIH